MDNRIKVVADLLKEQLKKRGWETRVDRQASEEYGHCTVLAIKGFKNNATNRDTVRDLIVGLGFKAAKPRVRPGGGTWVIDFSNKAKDDVFMEWDATGEAPRWFRIGIDNEENEEQYERLYRLNQDMHRVMGDMQHQKDPHPPGGFTFLGKKDVLKAVETFCKERECPDLLNYFTKHMVDIFCRRQR